MTSGKTSNLVLKRMLQLFLKIPPIKKILRLKEDLYQKENLKSQVKPVLEDLKDELYQLENKQAKGAKLHPNIR